MMDVIIITGQSGAGKTMAVDALEDRGVFCVDNVPPTLIPSFVDIAGKSGSYEHLAIVTDSRTGDMFMGLMDSISEIRRAGYDYKILYLQCSDEVLERRYRETRRRHPLQKDRRYTISEAIAKEREMLKPAYEIADFHVDTTFLSVAQLKENVASLFSELNSEAMTVRCLSFGFKYGVPTEADLVFDARCLPNPFYVESLKEHSGLDQDIQQWLMQYDDTVTYLEKLYSYLDFTLPLYKAEGKSQLVIAVGCTGGRHRSVFIANELYNHIQSIGFSCSASHRDMGKATKQ